MHLALACWAAGTLSAQVPLRPYEPICSFELCSAAPRNTAPEDDDTAKLRSRVFQLAHILVTFPKFTLRPELLYPLKPELDEVLSQQAVQAVITVVVKSDTTFDMVAYFELLRKIGASLPRTSNAGRFRVSLPLTQKPASDTASSISVSATRITIVHKILKPRRPSGGPAYLPTDVKS